MASDVDGESVRALLRAAPPAEALTWLAKAADARSVDVAERMPGGISLAMHRVTISLADGTSVRLVLRRYVRPEQINDDPGGAAHEAAVHELVAPIATPTPRLIAVDATGADAGTPAVLMTELAGRPDGSGGQRWMRQLIEILDDVHGIDAETAAGGATLRRLPTRLVHAADVGDETGAVGTSDRTRGRPRPRRRLHVHPSRLLSGERALASPLRVWTRRLGVGQRRPTINGCCPLPHQSPLPRSRRRRHLHEDVWNGTPVACSTRGQIVTIIGLLAVYRRQPPSARDRIDMRDDAGPGHPPDRPAIGEAHRTRAEPSQERSERAR